MKILPQPKHTPGSILLETDSQIITHQLPVLKFQFVSGNAIDRVDAELRPPILAQFWFIKPFHHENEFLDVLRHGLKPLVVLGRVFRFGRRQQLDHRAERSLWLRIGRLSFLRCSASLNRSEYFLLISSSTRSKSFWKSVTKTGPWMIASLID